MTKKICPLSLIRNNNPMYCLEDICMFYMKPITGEDLCALMEFLLTPGLRLNEFKKQFEFEYEQSDNENIGIE